MNILFIGGDDRMKYAAKKLSEKHETAFLCSEPQSGAFNAIVLPLPLTKDGKTVSSPAAHEPITFDRLSELFSRFADEQTLVLAGGSCPALEELCDRLGCKLINYFDRETLTLQNAALTAEAAMCLLSQSTDGALLGSRALILGSGRIAEFLSLRLKACECSVTLCARNAAKLCRFALLGFDTIPLESLPSEIGGFDFVANTIPAPVLDVELFSKMRKNAVYTELATLPALPYEEYAERFGIKYIHAGGLPGKYSPKAAGEFIAQAIEEIALERIRCL